MPRTCSSAAARPASRSARIAPRSSCRSARRASPRCAARSRCATTIRSSRRCPADTTNSTGRCGWTRCSFRGSGSSCSTSRRSRSCGGCSGISCIAGCRRAEFTLGLALACTHAMGLAQHDQTIDYLIDLVIDVQTVRSCLTAAERDPQFTAAGYCYPNHLHLRLGQHRDAEGAAAHERDHAHRARFVAGGRADRSRHRRAGDGRGTGRVVRRRRLHGAAARGAAADWRGITCRRRWTRASWRSSCTPMAASRSGAAASAAASIATTSWPTRCCGRSPVPMPEIDLSSLRETAYVPRRVVTPPVR